MLADNLVRHAQREAVVDGDTRLSYAELEQRLQRVTAGLRALGLGRGDVVALWAPNSWQWVVAATACWWSGCTLVPIAARGRVLDALPILQATRAKLLFTCSAADSGNLPSLIASHLLDAGVGLEEWCPHLRTIVDFADGEPQHALNLVGIAQFVEAGSTGVPVPCAAVAGEDICEILFTSGSTGRPKGVLRRHDQSLGSRWACSRERGYSHEDRLLVISEFSHSLGLNSNLLCSLLFGATLVIANNRNPADIARLMRAERITSISAAPSLFAGLLREQVDAEPVCGTLRLALTAGTDVPPVLVRELIAQGVGAVVTSYGMTECVIIASTHPSDSADVIATTVGTTVPGLDVQIIDESGTPVPTGVAGEIRVRGDATCTYYLGANGQLDPAVDAEGWLHTGDIGCFTAGGYLRILGRKKDVLTIHGYTLYPAEIETLLSRSGMLKDIAVTGVPHALAGELCVAFIVPADPSTFSLKRLRLWARANMADYKIPARFMQLDQLPLNRAGKVDRIALRDSLRA